MVATFEQAQPVTSKSESSELNLNALVPMQNESRVDPISNLEKSPLSVSTLDKSPAAVHGLEKSSAAVPAPDKSSPAVPTLDKFAPASILDMSANCEKQGGAKDATDKMDQVPGNPLFPGADPDILVANKTYWIYPTNQGADTNAFFVHMSPDLKHWTKSGPILDVKDIAWAKNDGQSRHDLWAPGITQENGKYYLFYSLGAPDWKQSKIGLAVSDTPDGQFKDIGRPLVWSHNGFQAIDPMIFEDPKTGDHLLYCGGAGGARLKIFKLSSDLTTIEQEIPVTTPKEFTEGAFMHYANGQYYLSYSHGLFFNRDYSVHYATSQSPTGPWTYKGPILQSDNEHLSPGHHAMLQNPITGKWSIVYHRWNDAGKTGKLPPSRSVAIENLEYDKDGNILPVKMTNTGVDPAPL